MQSLAYLADRARSLTAGNTRAILAVVGAPGSGKTTLVLQLLDILRASPPTGSPVHDWIAHLPMDGFHLADKELQRLGRLGRKGAPDTFDAAGFVATLRRIQENTDAVVYAPGFERKLEQPIAGSIAIPREARLVVTEGLYLLHDKGDWSRAVPYFNESWYCQIDDGLRHTRLVDRHVAFGKSAPEAARWVSEVDEPNAAAVSRSRPRATLVVDPGQ